MGLSIRAYARHRGVSEAAVRKAITSGRITPEPDGSVDPAKADAQWHRNTDRAQQRQQSLQWDYASIISTAFHGHPSLNIASPRTLVN